MAPEYFLKNIYKNKIMNDTSVGFVSPFQTVFLQLMAPLYMAIWQILLQNMADAGYHIIGTDIPRVDFCLSNHIFKLFNDKITLI